MKKMILMVVVLSTLTSCIMGPEVIKKHDPDYNITYYMPSLQKFHAYLYLEEHFGGQLFKIFLTAKNSEELYDIKYTQVEFYGEDTEESIFFKTMPGEHDMKLEYEYQENGSTQVHSEYSTFEVDMDVFKKITRLIKKNDTLIVKFHGKELREYELEYDEIKKMKIIIDEYFDITTGVKIFYKNKK